MERKIIAVVVLLVASGYVLSLCFMGMNLSNDLTYVGGIMAAVVWFVFLPKLYKFLIWLLTWKRRKENGGESDNVGGVAGSSVDSDGELHNENRARDGRHRGGPVW